jgi:type 2 lantibiotic biosynthesis protein LanM
VTLPGGTQDAGTPAGALPAGWWLRALARHERPGSADRAADGERPAWCGVVERAVASSRPPRGPVPAGSWQEAFAVPLRSFPDQARALIAESARSLPRTGTADRDAQAVADAYAAALAPALARLSVRTLMLELDAARTGGLLRGADGAERFADYIRTLSTPAGLAALLGRYPVLARLLGTATRAAAEAGAELLARFAADRAQIVTALLPGSDPGPIAAVEPGLGDTHCGGRSVALLRFADGRSAVYKPRSLEIQQRFGEILEWLDGELGGFGLHGPRVLPRAGYGWMEFIAARPLDRPGDARLFYRREGALLAVLHVLRAADMHCENIIARGAEPVLIDVETLFHPVLSAPDRVVADPAGQSLAASVQRTSLLPYLTIGEFGALDRSGMGGDPGAQCPEGALDWEPPAQDTSRLVLRPAPYRGARNRPVHQGRPADPADHEADVLAGFRLGYDAIRRGRADLSRLIESCADLETRVVVRPSNGYAHLLDGSKRPELLRDAADQDASLDLLDEVSAGHPLWHRLVPDERAALWAGDLPLVSGRPGSVDLWTCSGRRLPGALERSGLDCAREILAAAGDVDRTAQEWVIRASLATRRPDPSHHTAVSDAAQPAGGPAAPTPAASAGPSGYVAADAARLLAAACALADRITAQGTVLPGEGEQGRVNWLGLQLVDDSRWLLLPMGAGLADGYLGVALFLAQLSRVSGVARYARLAHRALNPLPQLLSALVQRPDLLPEVGCGGITGLGGMAYGLARLATLLDDKDLGACAETCVRLAEIAADRTAAAGWSDGTAGCLAAMTAVHAEIGSGAAADLATACADRLAGQVRRTEGLCADADGPIPTGFAAGPAGVGWALSHHASRRADPESARSAQLALWRASEQIAAGRARGHGWCRGAAGLLLARARLAEGATTAELQTALHALTARPVLRDLSPCHGELGIAETLSVVAAAEGGRTARRARHLRAGLVLGALQRRDRYCATPGGVPTPGLLHGLAGIGYGLLRLGFAEQVPSVLLLEPTP